MWIFFLIWSILKTFCRGFVFLIKWLISGGKKQPDLDIPPPDINVPIDLQQDDILKKAYKSIGKEMTSGFFFFGKKSGVNITKSEDKDEHILIVGGSGSGKTSCIAIPSLLTWEKPVFCIDIKGELYENTHKIRKKIKRFNPEVADSFGYDPFYLLGKTNNIAQETKAIATALIPIPPDIKDPFWLRSAQNMLTGFILHFYDLKYTFIDTMHKIQTTPIGELIDSAYDTTKTEKAKVFLNAFRDMETKVLAGIYGELCNHIDIFATDEEIIKCLSTKENITPEDLEHGNDVFICVPQHLLGQWKNLFTLIVSQFLRHFEKRPEMTATPILFLLDEFPRLGKLDVTVEGLATLRSKKITFCPIIQSLAQLDLIYGQFARRVIVENCRYIAILNATDVESQEYFSKLVGTYEPIKTTHNQNYEPITNWKAGTSTARAMAEKMPIIKPEEFATLPDIVLLTPMGFTRIEKAPYYKK